MCIHVLLLRFIECGHFERTPTAGPGFIPAAKCVPVLAALDRYHMQPELQPLQWPYPPPQACRAIWGTTTCRGNVVAATCFGKCADCRRLEYLVRLALWFRNTALVEARRSKDEEADSGVGVEDDTDLRSEDTDSQTRRKANRRRKKRDKATAKTREKYDKGKSSRELAEFWRKMSDCIKNNLASFTNGALTVMVDNIWGRYRIWGEVSPRVGRFVAAMIDHYGELLTEGERYAAWTFLLHSSPSHHINFGIRLAGDLPPISEEDFLDAAIRGGGLQEVQRSAPVCSGEHHCQRDWPTAATRHKVVANAALVLCGTMDRDRAAQSTRRIAPIFNSWLLSIDSREDFCGAIVGAINPNPAPEEWWRRDSKLASHGRCLSKTHGGRMGQHHRSPGEDVEWSSLEGCTDNEIAFLKEQGLI